MTLIKSGFDDSVSFVDDPIDDDPIVDDPIVDDPIDDDPIVDDPIVVTPLNTDLFCHHCTYLSF